MTVEPDNTPPKEYVSVTEMSRMLCLSRSRLYQLIRQGILLPPIQNPATKRPIYPREIQVKNLEAKRTNCGVNGQAVLFYAKRTTSAPKADRPGRKRRQRKKNAGGSDLVGVLAQLGLTVKVADVRNAIASCYPNGVTGVDEGEKIRTIFRHLKRSECRNRADNVG